MNGVPSSKILSRPLQKEHFQMRRWFFIPFEKGDGSHLPPI